MAASEACRNSAIDDADSKLLGNRVNPMGSLQPISLSLCLTFVYSVMLVVIESQLPYSRRLNTPPRCIRWPSDSRRQRVRRRCKRHGDPLRSLPAGPTTCCRRAYSHGTSVARYRCLFPPGTLRRTTRRRLPCDRCRDWQVYARRIPVLGSASAFGNADVGNRPSAGDRLQHAVSRRLTRNSSSDTFIRWFPRHVPATGPRP